MKRSSLFLGKWRYAAHTSLFIFVLIAIFSAYGTTYAAGSCGTTVPVSISGAYSENFDTLASAHNVLASTLPNGWCFEETGTNANTTYNAHDGSINTGNTYSFGANGSSERALGALQSGSVVPIIGAGFTNNTGTTITTLQIAYVGEEWRLGTADRTDRLDFQYSVDATSLITGTWVNEDSLDFTTPNTVGPVGTGAVSARPGNDPAYQSSLSYVITGLNIANGSSFWIKWTDFNASGADDGLAVDTFSLTPNPVVDLAPTVTGSTPAQNGTNVAINSSITFTFSEAVNVADGGVSLVCNGSPFSVTGLPASGTSVVVTPSVALPEGVACTATLNAASVTDQDGTPNAMAANYVLNFVTVLTCSTSPITRIHTVQGSGDTSPVAGSLVAVEGVVTADFQSTGLNGFFLQEEDADVDGNPATSEGVFIFAGSTDYPGVTPGALVRVLGYAAEFVTSGVNSTQLSNLATVVACGSASLPTAATFDLPLNNTQREALEHMLVSVPETLTVTQNFELGRFGQLQLFDANGWTHTRPYQYTQLNAPSTSGNAAYTATVMERSIILDDGNSTQNDDPTLYPYDANNDTINEGLTASTTLRTGDTVAPFTGVLDQRFGLYRIQPVNPDAINFTAVNPRPTAAPSFPSADVTVASFNVLNYFNGNGTNQEGAAGGFPTSRGAESLTEFNRQRAKTVSALVGLDASVYGLIEMENDASGANSAIADLTNGLNSATSSTNYSYIDTGVIGTDVIRQGFIYNNSEVTPVGTFASANPVTYPAFASNGRPPVAQLFQVNATGAQFTVIVNHFKSKRCDDATGLNLDQGDGQSCYNADRVAAAQQLLQWINNDPYFDTDPDILIIGDLNSYAQEDPVTTLIAGGFTNMLSPTSYSYVFDGYIGSLDLALASSSLVAQVVGAEDWHINTDEPTVMDYNTNFKTANHINTLYAPDAYRSSDHDPVLIGLDLTPPPGFIIEPTSGLTTSEAGGTAQFTVKLATQPTASVVLALSTSDTTEGIVPASVGLNVFNWNTGATVTVTGVNDNVADGNIAYNIITGAVTSADPNYSSIAGSAIADVSVTNTDDEATPAVIVTPIDGLTTTEAGGTAQFNIKLATQPTANVTIALSSSDTTEGTVQTGVTITTANWNTGVNITVTGKDDVLDDADQAYTIITGAITSADPAYSGIAASSIADVSVTNSDNDSSGFTITPTSGLTTTEAGGTGTFSIKLTSRPSTNVTIAFSSSDTTEGTVRSFLTFTPDTWNLARTVIVTGVNDALTDGNIAYSIITGAVTSADSLYSTLDPNSIPDISVTNLDDEVVTPLAGVVTSISPVGTLTQTPVTFSWVGNASSYRLNILQELSVEGELQTFAVVKNSYDASVVCESGVCAVQPNIPLTPGVTYVWIVEAIGADGQAIGSAALSFTMPSVMVAPTTPEMPELPPTETGLIAPVTLVSPMRETSENPVAFTWIGAADATGYRLLVQNQADRSAVVDQIVEVASCNGNVCVSIPAFVPQAGVSYVWTVTPITASGAGAPSAEAGFSYNAAAPDGIELPGTIIGG